MQVIWTAEEAHNLALEVELLERRSGTSGFRRNSPESSFPHRDKGVQLSGPSSQPRGATGEEGSSNNQATVPVNRNVPRNLNPNPYARPTTGTCYRCRKPGHHSNACPDRPKPVDWVEEGEEDPKA